VTGHTQVATRFVLETVSLGRVGQSAEELGLDST